MHLSILQRCFLLISLLNVANGEKPNILLILADDLGWNDVDWHDSTMHTTVLHNLAHSPHTVQLDQAYVNQVCSPTRSALLSGYYPYHLGTQHYVFKWLEPSGVPLNHLFFPEKLATLGYNRYMVGKWHLGYCKHDYLPTKRGQQTKTTVVSGLDLFHDTPHSFVADWTSQGLYSTEIFVVETVEMLGKHDKRNPFFFYLAFQAVHSPLQVPSKYVTEKCANIKRKERRIYCGMVNAMDEAIGKVVNKLKELDMYNDTIIIFSSDNGGQTIEGGNNYPLRGNKNTLWEGGTRTNSFVHAPQYISSHNVRKQLFSVVDWYATILGMAGENITAYGDGLNQWPMILTDSKKNIRKNFVYNIDMGAIGYEQSAAIRSGDYKLIVGHPGRPAGWIPPDRKVAPEPSLNQTSWLFDIKKDPNERRDLSRKKPLIHDRMMRQLLKYARSAVASIHKPLDDRGNPRYFNGTFASGWC